MPVLCWFLIGYQKFQDAESFAINLDDMIYDKKCIIKYIIITY